MRNSRAAGLPPLQDPDAIRRVDPPRPLPALGWTEFGPDGAARPETLARADAGGLVLNFWAAWCDPCVREMPALARLAGLLGPDRIAVVPLAFDHTDAAEARAFYAGHAIGGLPVAVDPDGLARRALGIEAIPVTLLVDRRRRLVGRAEGAVDWVSAAPRIRRLLAPA